MIRTALGVVLLLLLGGVRATESDPSGAAAVPPGPARLVHDFFPGQFEDEQPLPQLTPLGNALFFLASDRQTGTTVWRTDGSPGGTRGVPVMASAAGTVLTGIVGVVGERMLLSGTAAGDPTTPLLFAAGEQGEAVSLGAYQPGSDLPAPLGRRPVPPTAILGARYYFKRCGEVRCEIWSTDGTPAGTAPVPAFAGQPDSVHQDLVATFAGRWLIVASGPSLVAYDVEAGRVLTLLADWEDAGVYPVGESLFLLRPDGLYVSTLAAPRASLLFAAPGLASAGWRGETFFFVPPNGRLWSTDGKSVSRYTGGYFEPFSVVADRLGAIGRTTLMPMPGYYGQAVFGVDEASRRVTELHRVCTGKYDCLASSISPVTYAGSQGFMAINGELWHSDGTPQGTLHHKSLTRPDAGSFAALDGRLVLGARSWKGEQRLWATDGTVAGTRALSDGGGDRPFRPQGPAAPLGGALITAADRPPVGQQLWRIADGRTEPLTDLRHVAKGLHPSQAFPLGGGRVVLAGGQNGNWSGVTPHRTVDFLPIWIDQCYGLDPPCPIVPVAVGGHLLFKTLYEGQLMSTDGTASSLRPVPLDAAALGRFRDLALIFGAGGDLWTSDGSSAEPHFVAQLPAEPLSGSPGFPVGAPFAVGPVSYLFRRLPDASDDTLADLELWRTDGTAAGTQRLASIPFDQQAAPYPSPVPVAGKLFFRVLGVLWESDGTAAGTHALAEQLPGGAFALQGGDTKLYAAAVGDGADSPESLWAIDPSTLKAVKVATSFLIGVGFPGYPIGNVVGDTLFFRAEKPGGIQRWWRTGGTPGSTSLLPDFLARNVREDFVTVGDRRYFKGCDAAHGCELWSTDRLGEDTRLVQDLWVGARGSDPEILAVTGSTLWFSGTQPDVGNELWSLDLPPGTAATAWIRPPAPRARRTQEPSWKRRLR